MKAQSIKGKTPEEIQAALDNCISEGLNPTLAIAFASVSQDLTAIRRILDQAGITIFGLTTNGEFIDEVTEKKSIAIQLLELNRDAFQIFFEEYPEENYREVAQSIARQAQEKFPEPAYLVGLSYATVDAEEILHGLEDVAGKDINAFGGCAGDDYSFTTTYVFTNEKETSQGMVCLVFDQEKVKVSGVATCGWKAVGTDKLVTKSEGNHVYTIEGVPAAEITARYGGLELTPESQDSLIDLAANFPLQLQRENGEAVMRPGLVVDWDDYSFYCTGKVPQGSKIRFSLPPDWDVMQKVVTGVQQLKDSDMPEADAVIVFSCAGRILSFGPMMTSEIEGIRKVWNVPMIGMFSNAELGRTAGGNLEMHNLTTCCIALKEL